MSPAVLRHQQQDQTHATPVVIVPSPPLPPLTLPGMPCNSSHGHGAAEQHAEHTDVHIVIVHIVILVVVVAVVGLRVCAKNSQFIPE